MACIVGPTSIWADAESKNQEKPSIPFQGRVLVVLLAALKSPDIYVMMAVH